MAGQSIKAGQMAHISYNSGFIVLSYLVSLVGCITTLELLQRRTSRRGLYNWYLLITSSITMGGNGIWCMHFIGNRAIILADGQYDLQIVYSSGFTAISFFLPIIALFAAFYLLGVTEKAGRYYILLSGTITGTAVCGMHYSGQLGIANYYCSYYKGLIVAAAVIAIFASSVALTLFFRLRAQWSNAWWKRTFCGSIMASAVCGMHFTASVGTFYRFKGAQFVSSNSLSPTQTVIVCAILSFSSCVLLLTIAIIANRREKITRNRAQQIVLACAYFDDSGRVMVTPEGYLPSQKVTNQYIEKTFAEDGLNKSHPAFLWAFRATRNWKALKDLISGMRDHLVSDEAARYHIHGQRPHSLEKSAGHDMDYSTIFKELFCVTAQDLANQLHQPLESMGVLYDAPVETGTQHTISNRKPAKFSRIVGQRQSTSDVESINSHYLFGKGQFLFVVRRLSKPNSLSLAAAGFRFATISQISDLLARSMQIPLHEMVTGLENLRDYSRSENMIEPGVYVACFILRPTVRKNFDVLVSRKINSHLPMIRLPFEALAQWQLNILRRVDDWTVAAILKWLNTSSGYSAQSEQEFCQQMFKAVSELAEHIEDPAIMRARFSARTIIAPCRWDERSYFLGQCNLLCIRAINTVHARPPNPRLTYVPLRSFKAQQQVFNGSVDHKAFARQVRRDFGHCRRRASSRMALAGTPLLSSPPFLRSKERSGRSKSPGAQKSLAPSPAFGGIMVSSDVSVDVTEFEEVESENRIEMSEMRTTVVETGIGAEETETFVDELYAMCRDGRPIE